MWVPGDAGVGGAGARFVASAFPPPSTPTAPLWPRVGVAARSSDFLPVEAPTGPPMWELLRPSPSNTRLPRAVKFEFSVVEEALDISRRKIPYFAPHGRNLMP